MSVLKFKLTAKHLKLLRHLKWESITENKSITTSSEGSPFGGLNHYEDMGLVLYGKPDDFDPFGEEPIIWTEEQLKEMDELLNELPTAIEIILNTMKFETGEYKCRYHIREWK